MLKFFSENYAQQYNLNILLSNILVWLLFFIFKNSLLQFLSYIPHYCLIDRVMGFACPVCGVTRAFCEISKGDLGAAYLLNAASIMVALFFIAQIPLRLVSLFNSNYIDKVNLISKYGGRIVLIVILLNWSIKLIINL